MRVLIFSFLLPIANCLADVDLPQRLEQFTVLANQKKLAATDLNSLEKIFSYPADYAVFEQVKKRGRFFSKPDLRTYRIYNSLFIAARNHVVFQVDFREGLREVAINGAVFKYSLETALTPQLEVFLKGKQKTAALFLDFLVRKAEAAPAEMSEELAAVVAGILMGHKKIVDTRFSASAPIVNTRLSMTSFNQKDFDENSALNCAGTGSQGVIEGKVNGDRFAVAFNTIPANNGFTVRITAGTPPRSFDALNFAGSDVYKEVACLQNRFLAGTLPPEAEVDPKIVYNFRVFQTALYLNDRNSQTHPIVRKCEGNPEPGCLSKICQGDQGFKVYAWEPTTRGFDTSLFPPLKTADVEFENQHRTFAVAVGKLSELPDGMTRVCQNKDTVFNCLIPQAVIDNHPDFKAQDDIFKNAARAFLAKSAPYKTAIDSAIYIASAAHACCLDAKCPGYYKKLVQRPSSGSRQ